MNNNVLQDKILKSLIEQEMDRQSNTISLIASENYVDGDILSLAGSVLTNKYAEGYPGSRYYAGCSIVDAVEQLAQERCKKLFSAEHANVQPHSGSQANQAVFFATLKPGDLIMGMSLSEGGHLTHGHKVNYSGMIYRSVQYTVDRQTELLDFDEIERLAHEHKPKLIIAGASSYSRTIDFEKFSTIAKKVNALFMADIAHIAGLVAANVHPSPLAVADFVTSTTHKTLRGPRGGFIMSKKEYGTMLDRAIIPGTQGGPFMHVIAAKAAAFEKAMHPSFASYQQQIVENARAMAAAFVHLGYRIVSGGTDNHMFVVDLSKKQITGKDAEQWLERSGITVSRSCIPFDTQKPQLTSGIRIGTPAITTRGMGIKECIEIVYLIDRVLNNPTVVTFVEVETKVKQLCSLFTLESFMGVSLSDNQKNKMMNV